VLKAVTRHVRDPDRTAAPAGTTSRFRATDGRRDPQSSRKRTRLVTVVGLLSLVIGVAVVAVFAIGAAILMVFFSALQASTWRRSTDLLGAVAARASI
jgi:hypothetical protein